MKTKTFKLKKSLRNSPEPVRGIYRRKVALSKSCPTLQNCDFIDRGVGMFGCYELKSHKAETLCVLLRKLNKLPRQPVHWIEWDKQALEAGYLPEICIIDAMVMSSSEIVYAANSCRSKFVAVWGRADAIAGLPSLSIDFTTHELLKISNGVSNKTLQPNVHKTNAVPPGDLFLNTMPLGISANWR